MKISLLVLALFGAAYAAPAKPPKVTTSGAGTPAPGASAQQAPSVPPGQTSSTTSSPLSSVPSSPDKTTNVVQLPGNAKGVVGNNPAGQTAQQLAPDDHATLQKNTAPSTDPLTGTIAVKPNPDQPDGLRVTGMKAPNPTSQTGQDKLVDQYKNTANAANDGQNADLIDTRLANQATSNTAKQDKFAADQAELAKTNPAAAEAMKAPKDANKGAAIHVEQQTETLAKGAMGGADLPPDNTATVQGVTNWHKKEDGPQFQPGCETGPTQPGCGTVTKDRQAAGQPTANFDVSNIDPANAQDLQTKNAQAVAEQQAAKDAEKKRKADGQA
ncbi:Hypothetical protein D9617_10g073160 [Elsinoe fawcettii]|nr:Hypothetical protein D9617_10g073160 [Elsinoe fawcettii]